VLNTEEHCRELVGLDVNTLHCRDAEVSQRKLRGTSASWRLCVKCIYSSTTHSLFLTYFLGISSLELLTKAIFLLSGDQLGTLMVPCPPKMYAIVLATPPAAGIKRK
jgi:hypothetical protein